MTIKRDGKYLVDFDLKGRLSIGIESGKIAACVAEAKRRDAYGVFGSPSFKFNEDNLDFLAGLPGIRKVWFWDVTLANVEGIYALGGLREFGIHTKRPAIDFGRLRKLEQVVWTYHSKDTGLALLEKLRMLHIWSYNPKHRSFEGLDFPDTIEELQINWANPKSLAGLPRLPGLKRLELHRCRNLETLQELPRIAPNVEHLVVAACGRVADGEKVVRRLPKLRHAYVRDAVLTGR